MAVLLVPAYLALGYVESSAAQSYWWGLAAFTGVMGAAVYASVAAGRRLSSWWFVLGGFWGLVYLLVLFGAVAFSGM